MTEDTVRTERCVGCGEDTTRPVLVRCIEVGSGPGAMLFACPDCAPNLLPPTDAWELVISHAVACETCREWPCETLQILLGVWRKVRRSLHPVPVSYSA
jgi:hypothetical protein